MNNDYEYWHNVRLSKSQASILIATSLKRDRHNIEQG
jgi:hypothetical protein